MALNPEVVAARIDARVCELKVAAAKTFAELARSAGDLVNCNITLQSKSAKTVRNPRRPGPRPVTS
jgi:hypothetical protein